jgi:hypothetical protein
MTTAKRKHLIEALLSSRVPQVALPDHLYEDYAKALALESSEAVARGLLVVSPRPGGANLGRLRRSEVGVLPPSLMEQLDLYESILDFVVQALAPRCPGCGIVAEPPVALRSMALPGSGFVAACLTEEAAEISLRDRCELLGVERAVVNGYVVRIDSLRDEEGEPVVAIVAAQSRDRFEQEVDRWFVRGGGDVRVLHFSERDSAGKVLGCCSRSWRCPTCRAPLEAPSRQALHETAPCSTCRGAGWLSVDGGRYTACRDCEGFGSLDVIRRSDFGGIELQHVATLTFAELRQIVMAKREAHAGLDLAERLRIVCESGFSAYPIGASVDLLSQGEQALLSIAVGKLSRFDGVVYAVDRALVAGVTLEEGVTSSYADVRLVQPESRVIAAVCAKGDETASIVVRDVLRGPLRVAEVAFPIGALTAVQGPVGVGKSLLIDTLAERFGKRRKYAHNTMFGSLKRCHRIRGGGDRDGVLLDLLGLSTEFAAEIARTKEAKRAGILVDDLELPHSPYRCGECAGMGQGLECAPCGVCGGDLFDWRVSEIQVAGVSVGRALQMTIRELGELFWTSDRLSYLFKRFPMYYGGELRLNTPLGRLTSEARRFLRIWSGLLGVLSGNRTSKPRALAGDLVLLDGPSPLVGEHLAEIGGVLSELCTGGASVIYAGIPESLESHCACVVRLALSVGGQEGRETEEFLDMRYSRIASVS